MTPVAEIRRIWPEPSTGGLDDAGILAGYGRPARPALRVNFVTSLDGAVELAGYSAGLSPPADRRVLPLLRRLADAVVVAAGTLRAEGYGGLRLGEAGRAWRRENGLPEQPTLVVVSGSARFAPTDPIFADAPVRPVLLTRADAAVPAGLDEVADILRLGHGTVDLAAGLAALRSRGLAQLLCEGGPLLFGSLTAADLVDELCLTVSPLLAGPGAGRITAGPPAPPRGMALRQALAAPDGTLLLHYRRHRDG
ncbi:pyrimidine reductase family protein [Plantactinospora siamensis]|uniref:Pyrimidine reductase family protein n=1 Tax=Plantactinospora siamensis TaxID=555372 RepID=A0ABV6NS80_9ACTN